MSGLPRLHYSLLVATLVGLTAAGCTTTSFDDYPDTSPTYNPRLPSAPPEARTESVRPSYAGPWEDPSSPLYERTIYFSYDSAEIPPEYVALMRTHARYLGTRSDTRVMLEGHTDERGTREYNLALGDQRAEAVKRFMLAEGVLPDQMATLSYGEERPVELGHSESAWRRNRRVIIQY